jgi:hypothetical protein
MKSAKRYQGPPVDWEYWRRKPFAFPWEAAALSLGIEPRHLRKPEHRDQRPAIDASLFTDQDIAGEFRSRWNMLDSNVRTGTAGLVPNESGAMAGEVRLADMARWLAKEFDDAPRELSELASPSSG